MNSKLLALILPLGIVLPGWVYAQNNPFGAPAGGAAQQPGTNPFGAPGGQPATKKAGKAAPAAGKKKKKKLPPETDPIVLAITDSNPTSPADLLKAIQSMRRLNRPRLAKNYLEQLMGGNLNADALIKMHDKYGTGFFRDLSLDAKLQPDSGKLYKDVLNAANEYYRDVTRIDDVIRRLSSQEKSVQLTALLDLKKVGGLAIRRMLSALADGGRGTEHPNIRKALVALGPQCIEPAVGALEATDPKFRAQVIHVLGRLKAGRAVMYLLQPMFLDKDPLVRQMAGDSMKRIIGSLPSRDHAERYLYRRIDAHLGGQLPFEVSGDNLIQLFHWDAANKTVVSVRYAPRAAAKLLASQAAAALLPFDPDKTDYRRAYLIARLAATKLVNGIDKPLADFDPEVQQLSKVFKTDELEDALREAIRRKEIAAAIGTAEVMGHVGTPALVYGNKGRQRTLTAAIQHPDRRLQFAATEAVLALDPVHPFPGASSVVRSLTYIIRNGGARRVVVGHPLARRVQSIGGHISAAGFEIETARTGRMVFTAATRNPDVELILLSNKLAFPRTIEVYQALRRSPATSSIPIAIVCDPDDLTINEELYRNDPITAVVVEPHSRESVAKIIQGLQALPQDGMIDFRTRIAQARRALLWVSRLAENPRKYDSFDLQRLEVAAIHALQTPDLSREAARFLGLLGTPKAQQALVDMASTHSSPLVLRQAAADSFRQATKRRRVLLTTVSIRRQYDRYNDTKFLDRPTQKVMGSILDAIEGPSKEKQVREK